MHIALEGEPNTAPKRTYDGHALSELQEWLIMDVFQKTDCSGAFWVGSGPVMRQCERKVGPRIGVIGEGESVPRRRSRPPCGDAPGDPQGAHTPIGGAAAMACTSSTPMCSETSTKVHLQVDLTSMLR